MRRNRWAITALLLTLSGSEAFATPITVVAGNPGSVSPGYAAAPVVNFNGLTPGSLGSYTFDSRGPNGAVTLTGTGAVENTSRSGVYAQPAGITGDYLTVSDRTPSGAELLTFSVPENYFGLYWGSIDAYNFVSFLNQGQVIAAYSGTEVAALTGLTANGGQSASTSNRYVNIYTADNFFDAVSLSTNGFGFEVAYISYADPPLRGAPAAVPEPGSGLLLLSFALFGFAAVRRQRQH